MSGDRGNSDPDAAEIARRFVLIAKNKFTAIADDADKIKRLDALYKRPEFDAEKRILNDLNETGLTKGVLAGLGCFAFLRLGPWPLARMLQRRAGVRTAPRPEPSNPFHHSPGYKLDPVVPAGQANSERPGLLFRVFRFTLDSFVSVSVAAYASLYFTDTEKIMKQLGYIPLVEGRSLVAEELCVDFARELRGLGRRAWDPRDPALRDAGRAADARSAALGFVANCHRRALHEAEVRQEGGAGRLEEPVAVPAPGVPRDIAVSLDELLEETEPGGEEAAAGDMVTGDEYFDTYFGTDNDKQN